MNIVDGDIFKKIKRLKSPKPWVRLRAVSTLVPWQSGAAPALPFVVDMIKDESIPVRQTAAFVLGEIGMEAQITVPALLRALLDDDWGVRQQAAMALGKFAGEPAIPALRQAMWDSSEAVRKAAKQAIEKILPDTSRKPAA